MEPRMNFYQAAPETSKALSALESQLQSSGLEPVVTAARTSRPGTDFISQASKGIPVLKGKVGS
jgi:hypothetical protein